MSKKNKQKNTYYLDDRKNGEIFIFTHIPKTSGSSLDKIISKYFKYRFDKDFLKKLNFSKSKDINKNIINKAINELKIFCCPEYIFLHIPYGIHNVFLSSNYKYITFLRNPISRYISFFNFVHRYTDTKRGIKEIYTPNSLKGQIIMFENIIGPSNQMVKYLGGYYSYEKILVSLMSKEKLKLINIPCDGNGLWFNRPIDFIKEGNFYFHKAVQNIDKYYFVGMQENFLKDCSKLLRKMRKKLPESELNKKYRVSFPYFQEKIKDLSFKEKMKIYLYIEEINKWDIAFYNYVKKQKKD